MQILSGIDRCPECGSDLSAYITSRKLKLFEISPSTTSHDLRYLRQNVKTVEAEYPRYQHLMATFLKEVIENTEA